MNLRIALEGTAEQLYGHQLLRERSNTISPATLSTAEQAYGHHHCGGEETSGIGLITICDGPRPHATNRFTGIGNATDHGRIATYTALATRRTTDELQRTQLWQVCESRVRASLHYFTDIRSWLLFELCGLPLKSER